MKKPILLQYTIDESQLPAETGRLLSNSIARLTSIAAEPPPNSEVMTMQTLMDVTGLREELATIDTMLGDVSSIIDQYLEYQFAAHQQMKQNENGELEMPEEFEAPDLSAVDFSNLNAEELTEKLHQVQEMQNPTSLEEIAEVVPGVKTKTVKVNSDQFDADFRDNSELVESLRRTNAELSSFDPSQSNLSQEDAMKALASLNDIDFSDLENVGSAVSAWKSKIGG